MKIDIAGVAVDALTKQEVLLELDRYARTDKPSYVVTPYSEFVVFANRYGEYKSVLNNAALSLPDGVGILWAAKYLSLKSSNPISALLQIIYTGASIVLNRKYIQSIIPQQISGSRLIWDIADLASTKNYSLGLVGGEGGVALKTAFELKKLYPNLKVTLAVSDMAFDERMIEEINASNSDILLIAYSPPKQEFWLAQNIDRLNVKVAIGLGGTFDYVSGKRMTAPSLIYRLGLEWLWRMVTQPWRIRRMWNAIPVFIWTVYKYKVKGNKL